jgi:hypothetical protein
MKKVKKIKTEQRKNKGFAWLVPCTALSGKIASPESVVSGSLRRLRLRAGLGARR